MLEVSIDQDGGGRVSVDDAVQDFDHHGLLSPGYRNPFLLEDTLVAEMEVCDYRQPFVSEQESPFLQNLDIACQAEGIQRFAQLRAQE